MTPTSLSQAFIRGFLGQSPEWYKLTIVGFLIINPIVLFAGGFYGPLIASWLVLAEFIFTLVMALRCYPLQPGGLIALEAVLLGLTSPASAYHQIAGALPVLLLLIFMIAAIYFLKDLLLYGFTRIVLGVRSNVLLSLIFFFVCAVLAAFLNALTVLVAVVTLSIGFYQVFHRVASGKHHESDHSAEHDAEIQDLHRSDLDGLRGFLSGLVMHAAVGTAVGGAMTPVGQPHNVLIATHAGWNFAEFFTAVAPVMLPLFVIALVCCALFTRLRWFSYGEPLPASVRQVLDEWAQLERGKRNARDRAHLIVQGLVGLLLVAALVFQTAEVGLIGLATIVLVTSFTGVTEEHRLGRAFTDALPFTALVVVFFVIVAVLQDQHTFEPILYRALQAEGSTQTTLFFFASGLLSAISDNVFVSSIFITDIKAALLQGVIDRPQFESLAVAIDVGSNVTSIATPNGQAAFLFILTSTLAPLIRLSFGRMVMMALPYAVVLSAAAALLFATRFGA